MTSLFQVTTYKTMKKLSIYIKKLSSLVVSKYFTQKKGSWNVLIDNKKAQLVQYPEMKEQI